MAPIVLINSGTLQIKDAITHLSFDSIGKKICFVTTAAEFETNRTWLDQTEGILKNNGLIVERIDISRAPLADFKKLLETSDCLYISGGNSFYLLQEIVKSGAGELIKAAIKNGMPYIGESAGAILLGPTLEPIKITGDPSKTPNLKNFDGLNLIDFVPLVHFGEGEYREKFQKVISFLFDQQVRFIVLRENEFLVINDGNFTICGTE